MVRLPQGYCIDSTEVTRGQYAAWLNGSPTPSTTGQISDCTWNTSFVPDASCMGMSDVCQTGCDNHPQVCVDWCDAYAYCQAVGKRLCGKIGGGSVGYNDYVDVSLSQWYNACTSHGANTYAYGNTYDRQACNDANGVRNTTVAVGTLITCQSSVSGYGGVYDLSGNVYEWEDSCSGTGQSARCRMRSGSFLYGGDALCSIDFIDDFRSYGLEYVGLRCCSSP
jgi:formylglycine-generating enzyme required for sulfatase activity